MKVVHIITRLIVGGAQENTLFNCQDLIDDYGDEVSLLCGPGLGPEGDLVPTLKDSGVETVVIPSLRRPIHPWRDWQGLRAISREICRIGPDVVHTHSGKAGLLGRVAAHRLNVPAIVHTVHGAPFHEYQNRIPRELFRRCERFAARRCHRMISVADAMTERMVAAGIADESMFRTILSGLDMEPFLNSAGQRESVRRHLGFSPDDIVVAKVARLFPLKGHCDILAAMQQAVIREPRLRLLLVGDGLLRQSLESQVAERGLQDHVVWTGLVPPHQVPGLLAASDMVVHVSYREGLPRVIPQALLAERPVIAYDIDGAKEVVHPGETGILLPPGDIDQLTRALLCLAGDASKRARLAENGREFCRLRFDHRQMTAQIRALYGEILSLPVAGD